MAEQTSLAMPERVRAVGASQTKLVLKDLKNEAGDASRDKGGPTPSSFFDAAEAFHEPGEGCD